MTGSVALDFQYTIVGMWLEKDMSQSQREGRCNTSRALVFLFVMLSFFDLPLTQCLISHADCLTLVMPRSSLY